MLSVFLVFLVAISATQAILPMVAWHGMGMSAHDGTMTHYLNIVKNLTNNGYVHSIRVGVTEEEDRINTYVMPANLQLDIVCDALRANRELWGGYNALGASQGALLFRALAQRCPFPPIRTLISLGGPQQGVFGLPECDDKYGPIRCDIARKELSYLVYDGLVQDFETQANYWHDSTKEKLYRERSRFLADINQEQGFKPDYKDNFLKLKKFVMVKFLRDQVVIPRESEWFGFFKENSTMDLYTVKESPLYNQDLLGFKTLEQRGDLHFESYDDTHCSFTDEWFVYLMKKYMFD